MPAYGTVQNPLDVTGAAIIDPAIFTRAIEAMTADPSVGVVGVINGLPWIDDGRPYAAQMFVDAIGAGMAGRGLPDRLHQPGHAADHRLHPAVMSAGSVRYAIPGLRQAMVALRNVAWWSEATRDVAARGRAARRGPPGLTVPAAQERHGRWSEDAARRLLAAAGLPVVPASLVTSADDAVKAAADFGGPVAIKVVSPRTSAQERHRRRPPGRRRRRGRGQ